MSFRLVHSILLVAVGGWLLPGSAMAATEAARSSSSWPLSGLAQTEEQSFDYEEFQFWVDHCLLLSRGDEPQKTLEACEKAISLEPDEENLPLWAARSQALFQLQQYPEAITSFNQILRIAPQDSVSLAYQCAAYRQLNRYDDAVDTCETALRLNGNWGNRSPGFAWYHRGMALQAMGRLETALDSLSRAVDNQPENVLYRAHQCALAIELGRGFGQPDTLELDVEEVRCNLRQAIASYERALALTPGDSDLWIQQGLALEQLGDYERALTSYEQALSLSGNYSFALARQCAVLNQRREYEAALAACEAAFQGDRRWGRVGVVYGWVQHSRALIGLGEYEAALASAKRAIDLAPPQVDGSYPPAWNNLAVSLWHQERYDGAKQAIDQALELYTQSLDDLNLQFQRPYPEAPLLFYRGVILAHYNRGRILASQADYEAAVTAYQQALDIYAQAVTASGETTFLAAAVRATIYTQLAVAQWQSGDLGRASQAAEAAVDTDPTSFTAWYNRGAIALANTDYAAALAAYSRAEQLQPDNVYVLTGKGMALANLGCNQAALQMLEQALNQIPEYELANQERDRILAATQNTDSETTSVSGAEAVSDEGKTACPVQT